MTGPAELLAERPISLSLFNPYSAKNLTEISRMTLMTLLLDIVLHTITVITDERLLSANLYLIYHFLLDSQAPLKPQID